MRRLLGTLDAFWFVEGSATRLAALRVLVGSGVLAYLLSRVRLFSDIAASPPDLFEPVGAVTLLASPLSPAVFQGLLIGTLIANVAFILGWRFRWTGPLFAGLLLVVLCYRNSWSMIHHVDNLVVLHVLILGLTRSADALSLDALRGRSVSESWRRFVARATADAAPTEFRRFWHWEYGYPIRLLCAVAVITYVLSGIAKLAGPLGWSWALGESLRSQVAFDALRKELLEGGSQPLAYVVYGNLALSTAIGIGALLLEVGAVVALVNTRAGRFWAIMAYGMHWGIYAIMGIAFWYHLVGLAFAPFLLGEGTIRWCREEIVRWVRALVPPPSARVAARSASGHDSGDTRMLQ